MNTTFNAAPTTRDEAGHLIVPQPFPTAGRLFGVLYMVPGIKMVWDFINALREVAGAVCSSRGDRPRRLAVTLQLQYTFPLYIPQEPA